MFIIEDNTNKDVIFPKSHARGAVPRDYAVQPLEMMAAPKDMVLFPRSEWDARHEERKAQKSSLADMRLRAGPGGGRIPSLDQGRQGYCWAYSVVMSIMMKRMAAGMKYKRLSAHAVACREMNFANRGAWCGLSAQRIRKEGVPDVDHWPEKSMSRSHNTEAMLANAAKYKITEDWVDLTHPVYSQNLTTDQIATCLLQNIPVAIDYDEWGHSVCAVDWVRVEAGSWAPLIINSWTDQWGELGTGVIRTSWTPMGAVATVATTA